MESQTKKIWKNRFGKWENVNQITNKL